LPLSSVWAFAQSGCGLSDEGIEIGGANSILSNWELSISGGNGHPIPARSALLRYSVTTVCPMPQLLPMALWLSPRDHFSLNTSLIFRMDNLFADIYAPHLLLRA